MLAEAEAELEESSAGLRRETAHFRQFTIVTLYYLGEWKELCRRQEAFIEDARARGDLIMEVLLSSSTGCLPGLMADRPDAARAVVERASALWPRGEDYLQRRQMLALATTEQYREEGAGEGALELVEKSWRGAELSRMMKLSVQLRVECLFQRGGAYLAAAAVATGPRRSELLRAVDRDARTLERMRTKVGPAMGACLHAGAQASQGDRESAVTLLAEAEAGFAASEMAMIAAAVRRRRGQLLGGDEGRALAASADAAMSAQDIKNPARMTAMLLPGKWS
jgi:hypothetical protein